MIEWMVRSVSEAQTLGFMIIIAKETSRRRLGDAIVCLLASIESPSE